MFFGKKINVEGKVIVISGGSQGLGLALGRALCRQGARVTLVSRSVEKLRDAAESCKGNADSRVDYIAADVSDSTQCESLFSKLQETPDIVFCCAGGSNAKLFAYLTSKEIKTDLKIGYETSLYFAHAAFRAMIDKSPAGSLKTRHLVLCSSITAFYPFIGYGSYAPCKAAVRTLADILRQEGILYNIDVALLVPGNMDTPGYLEENRCKPEITKFIEGPSAPADVNKTADQIIRDFCSGKQMIYTDTVGWMLSGLQMGASPRVWPLLQIPIALVLALVAPLIQMYFNVRIRKSVSASKKD